MRWQIVPELGNGVEMVWVSGIICLEIEEDSVSGFVQSMLKAG